MAVACQVLADVLDEPFPTRKPADFIFYRKFLGDNLREPGRMDALKNMLFLPKADTAAMLRSTDLPLLVIMGAKDADFPDPAAEAQWSVDRLGAKLLLVQDAGHYPHTEMPEQVGPGNRRLSPREFTLDATGGSGS